MRERAGIFDLSAFAIFDVSGPGALDALQRVAMRQIDVAVGRVVYTPLLSPGGGFRSDLTIMRLGDDRFRVVTGGGARHGRPQAVHRPPARGRLGAARRRHDGLDDDRSVGAARARHPQLGHAPTTSPTRASASAPARTLEIGSQIALASRISYVGDLGWELYVPIEQGARLWDALWEAGEPHRLVPCGIGVYGTTGRLEKGYRAYGAELESEYDVVEAGMTGPQSRTRTSSARRRTCATARASRPRSSAR